MSTELLAPQTVLRETIPDDALYEVIDGQIVERPNRGTRQEIAAGVLLVSLGNHVRAHRLGRAVMLTLFDFTAELGRKRRPDVAFVSNDRWPRSKPIPDGDGWDVVPNLAVEVVSPSNAWDEMLEKIHEYFSVGVQRVWVVSGSHTQVHVFHSPTSVRILSQEDVLTDEDLLPGFELPLSELFEIEDATRSG